MPGMNVRAPSIGKPVLDARQERFALALASGLSKKNAARTAFVCERTAHRWAGQEAVKQRVRELTASIQERTIERVAAGLAGVEHHAE